MKIYETIQKARKNEITSFPGIHFFRNKINNKYYIGQALCIRKRFKNHCHSISIDANYPIYKAINKYGESNFEFGIIGVFKTSQSKEKLNISKNTIPTALMDIIKLKEEMEGF